MYRTDIRPPAVRQAFTVTSSVSVGLTITGADNQVICLAQVRRLYVGAAQTVNQALKVFDGSTEIFRAAGTGALKYTFYNPIRISEGNNLVVTTSVSVNTISGGLSLLYYIDER